MKGKVAKLYTRKFDIVTMGRKIINWINGASSIMEVWPDTESRMKSRFLQRSDSEAIYRDWQNVGKDIKAATEKYEHEQRA